MLQHADLMKKNGWRVILYIEDHSPRNADSARASIERFFGYSFPDIVVGWEVPGQVDAVFATIWYSARVVRDLPFRCRKYYFVQDYEAMFNPMGDAYLLAENSYRYGLEVITIGSWLASKLYREFGVAARVFDFCADRSIYSPVLNVRREKAVAFIYQPDKPRRCPMVGIEALGILKHRVPDVKIYTFGSSTVGQVWFPVDHLGLMPPDECASLYNRCAVGLCISSSNPSRIPFEMMACGLPVVEVHRDNTIYDLPESASLLCDASPESLAAGLEQLLADPSRLESMSQAALAYMAPRGVDRAFSQFMNSVDHGSVGGDVSSPSPIYNRPPLVAPVFSRSGVGGGPEVRFRTKASGLIGRLGVATRRFLAKGVKC
jgi:O-antigen biosynthesis protein